MKLTLHNFSKAGGADQYEYQQVYLKEGPPLSRLMITFLNILKCYDKTEKDDFSISDSCNLEEKLPVFPTWVNPTWITFWLYTCGSKGHFWAASVTD